MLHVFLMIDMVLEPFSYMYCEIGVIKRYCRFVSSPRFPHPIGRVSTCTGSSNAGESKRPELSSFFLFFFAFHPLQLLALTSVVEQR